MKRRLFIATMLGLLALLMCSTALACPNPWPCPGNTYDVEYAKEAYHLLVCTLCGYKTAYSHTGGQATCTKRAICEGCGHEYGEAPIGEHNWGEYTPDGNATCTADGTKTAKCIRCPETDTVADVGSALGHSFTNYVSDGNATCTADGTKTAKCDHGCGETDTAADVGSALGHSFTDYTSNGDATCTADGTKTAYCDHGCGTTDTVVDEGSALGHSFTDYTSNGNATCTADGTKTAKCDRGCGETDTAADVGSALGHSFTNYVSDGNATCTADGTKTAYCDHGCGTTDTVADVGSALGHSFTDYTFNGDATCTADGTKTAYCDHNCGATDTISDEGSALGHSFTNYVSDGNATCTADGTKTAKCDHGCGATDTISDEGSALGHNYKAVVTEPTCVKSGYTTYTCTRCNNSYTDNKTAALQHWYGPWSFSGDMTHSATCRRDGCGYVRTRDCAAYTVTVGDNLLSICPVCGNLNGMAMSELEGAITNADNDVIGIPGRGELIARGQEMPFDGILYALTIAHEYAGTLDEFTGMVHIEITLEMPDELPEFQLVRVDVTEADEDTERAEVWTGIEYNYEDGVLSFDTDTAGMFLLLPVE